MQLHLEQPSSYEVLEETSPIRRRAIECEEFPFEELSLIAERESWRKEIYRPIYHVHKWWAQRLGSVFRGVLLGALAPEGTNLLELFYSPVRYPDKVVFDPFMGSGTTIGEALKLGSRAVGRDINPVSYFQVQTALTLRDSDELQRTFREIEQSVAAAISAYYTSFLPDGSKCQVLYYFWVMQAPCPVCCYKVDLFSDYVFARHAYARRNPNVQVLCPKCGAISQEGNGLRWIECAKCSHSFDAKAGPVKGKSATCPNCQSEFTVSRAIRQTGSPPSYRMYAKLVLTSKEKKEYHPISDYDENLYQTAVGDLCRSSYDIPQGTIEPGYNTNQALNYGFRAWSHMFNARQLLCIAMLANRIRCIGNSSLRDAFACLFSGVLEFNNMFTSYKGEGTGAVRHMFYHHILKPERTPLEANIWGTPRSSGAFSTLFHSRLLRAANYARRPFELALSKRGSGNQSVKVENINEPIVDISNSGSYEEFSRNSRLYVSCGDSAVTDLPDNCVDLVVTDPPFFDNVHYSQLADFFFSWQRLILDEYPSHRLGTTRSESEVQNADAKAFTEKLTLVLNETARVLKDDGLLVFTYHHSRWEGWRSVLSAVVKAGYEIVACHPVKAELSVATPKHQAKAPINFDIIMVCRYGQARASDQEQLVLPAALARAKNQVERLQRAGWRLSRNDIGVMVMAQVISQISRHPLKNAPEKLLEGIEGPITEAIDHLI